MPEGHSVHRIARQFTRLFAGQRVEVTSPQGRFAGGAARISGRELLSADAVGKQMFVLFDNDLTLRVHLGIYGAWDFASDDTVELGPGGGAPLPAVTNSVIGQHEDSLASIGAPRRTRLRAGESESALEVLGVDFPPEPIGQVRARILAPHAVADLRGPTACEVLDPAEVAVVLARLGPDPLVDARGGRDRFVAAVRRRKVPIAQLLMDQSVVAGIGNVYRAELLYRARLDPYRPGNLVPVEMLDELWRDWTKLLKRGVDQGQMLTIDGLRGDRRAAAVANRADRHWVYHRTGEPCRTCRTPIAAAELAGRMLYWCPECQK